MTNWLPLYFQFICDDETFNNIKESILGTPSGEGTGYLEFRDWIEEWGDKTIRFRYYLSEYRRIINEVLKHAGNASFWVTGGEFLCGFAVDEYYCNGKCMCWGEGMSLTYNCEALKTDFPTVSDHPLYVVEPISIPAHLDYRSADVYGLEMAMYDCEDNELSDIVTGIYYDARPADQRGSLSGWLHDRPSAERINRPTKSI